jgi:hypothetical protein
MIEEKENNGYKLIEPKEFVLSYETEDGYYRYIRITLEQRNILWILRDRFKHLKLYGYFPYKKDYLIIDEFEKVRIFP